MNNQKKQYSFEEVLKKLVRYCAYQERSPKQVLQKASDYGIGETQLLELIDYLKKENFLDEERFAEAYVSGKVKIKRWGKYKLIEGLKQKGVEEEVIDRVIKNIDNDEALNNIQYLIDQKLPIENNEKGKSRLIRYLVSKGYESALVYSVMKERNLM